VTIVGYAHFCWSRDDDGKVVLWSFDKNSKPTIVDSNSTSGVATWRTLRNILVASGSGPLPPLCENMTSSVKPEVHNILHGRQRGTEPRPQLACTEKFGEILTCSFTVRTSNCNIIFNVLATFRNWLKDSLSLHVRRRQACWLLACHPSLEYLGWLHSQILRPPPRSFTSSSRNAFTDFCLHRFFWANRFRF